MSSLRVQKLAIQHCDEAVRCAALAMRAYQQVEGGKKDLRSRGSGKGLNDHNVPLLADKICDAI